MWPPSHQALFEQALAILRRGGVLCLPTETLYGLCADASNAAAMERICQLKHRPREKLFPLLLPSRAALSLYVREITPAAQRLIDRYWPGPLNLAFAVKRPSPLALPLTSDTALFRLSSDRLAAPLAAAFGKPLAATSANLSGSAPGRRVSEIPLSMRHAVDLVIDDGERPGRKGSTIVDVSGLTPRLVRAGDLDVQLDG